MGSAGGGLVILSEAKDLKMRSCRNLRCFVASLLSMTYEVIALQVTSEHDHTASRSAASIRGAVSAPTVFTKISSRVAS